MWAVRFTTLLCASVLLATTAAAEESAPFVTQLRLPARDIAIDVFAWRGASGVAVEASALQTLGIAAPASDAPIPLTSIPGLSYEEPGGDAAIVITCTAECYFEVRLNLNEERDPELSAPSSGGYANYEADAQWIEGEGARIAGIVEGALFGRWGLLQSSWIGQTGDDAAITRLETTWTVDSPSAGVRTRIGDSVLMSASGTPVRFGGIQIGRYFGLTPSMITYPTPALTGEAETASTVELYVDGALRAQGEVAAGPFVIEHAPVISGAGEAELVITDLLGRQQTITRPFIVSTAMLRQGLSDWSFALGAERRGFGRDSARYGDTFAAARYRYGLTHGLTLEAALEGTKDVGTAQAGAMMTLLNFGQAYVSQAQTADGGFTSASWSYNGRAWTIGAQFEQMQGAFSPLGHEGDTDFRKGLAANIAADFAEYGAFAFKAASVDFAEEMDARTLTFAYTPDIADGALSFRLLHTEREESELSAAISINFRFGNDISAHASADYDGEEATYRLGVQRSVTPERFGWRARATTGARDRIDVSALTRTTMGDSMAQAVLSDGVGAARVRHAGSVGWVETTPFAGRWIDGAFAVVDAGAPDISVSRNRLNIGETGSDGRIVVANLRPYGDNAISISADDLPLDRAPGSPVRRVTPRQGAGILVTFDDAAESLSETHILYGNGAPPPRGAILVRQRDGERFPVGSEGRIVLLGARDGDVLELEHTSCAAFADPRAVASGLELICTAAS